MNNNEQTYLAMLALNTEVSTIKTSAMLNLEEYEENPLGFILATSEDPMFREILVRYSDFHLRKYKDTEKQWEVSCLELPPKIMDSVSIKDGGMMIKESSQDFVSFFVENWH